MTKIACLVTNDLNQDQRMHRVCDVAHTLFDQTYLVGRLKSDSIPLLEKAFQQIRMKLPFKSGILFYAVFNMYALRMLLKLKPEVVYCADLDTLIAGSLYKMLKGGKLVFDAHEYFTEVPELQDSYIKKGIWRWVASWGIRRADHHITVNESLAEIFNRKYHRTFLVLRNVPMMHEVSDHHGDRNIMIYQGVLNKGRGLEEAIDAISKLKDKTLWIVGKGDLEERLKAKVNEKDDIQNIHFLGFKNADELRVLTRKAGIGLNLLDANSENYKLSLANKFFDYMHAGIPSINMNFPEYARINNETKVAVLIDKLDEYAIKDAVELLDKTNVYNQLSKNALGCRELYSWDVEKSKLESLFEDIS